MRRVLPLVLAGLSLAVSSPRAESVATRPIPATEVARLKQEAARERLQREELSRRIQAAVDQSSKVIAGLSTQAAAIRDPNVRVALDRRVAQAKHELQIELLRVQARFARENGRIGQAQDLEAQIAAFTAPRVTKPSVLPESPTTSTRPATGGAR